MQTHIVTVVINRERHPSSQYGQRICNLCVVIAVPPSLIRICTQSRSPPISHLAQSSRTVLSHNARIRY